MEQKKVALITYLGKEYGKERWKTDQENMKGS